nr:hypothetical protein [Parabacteroides sp. AM08-6]
MLNTEMRIVKWRIKYPEQFKQHANKLFLSPLHLVDKTSLVNIMEIVSGLFLSKRIVYQNGKPVHLTDLGKAFEWLLNIKLGNYYLQFTVMRIQTGASPFFRSFDFLMMNNTLNVFLFTVPIILCFFKWYKISLLHSETSYAKS